MRRRPGRMVTSPPGRHRPVSPAPGPVTSAMTAGEIVTLLVIGGAWGLIQFTGLKIWHAALVLVTGLYLALSPAGRHRARLLPRD